MLIERIHYSLNFSNNIDCYPPRSNAAFLGTQSTVQSSTYKAVKNCLAQTKELLSSPPPPIAICLLNQSPLPHPIPRGAASPIYSIFASFLKDYFRYTFNGDLYSSLYLLPCMLFTQSFMHARNFIASLRMTN